MLNNTNEMIRYGIAGIINTIVGYSIFLIMVYLLNVSPYYSSIVSYFLALCVAFILNKYFVFNIKNTNLHDILKFIISFFMAFGINLLILFLCLNILKLGPAVGQIFAMVFYTICFYILNKFVIFNYKKEKKK